MPVTVTIVTNINMAKSGPDQVSQAHRDRFAECTCTCNNVNYNSRWIYITQGQRQFKESIFMYLQHG